MTRKRGQKSDPDAEAARVQAQRHAPLERQDGRDAKREDLRRLFPAAEASSGRKRQRGRERHPRQHTRHDPAKHHRAVAGYVRHNACLVDPKR
nr:MAG TPA: hypothetical protein [Bacteriophage sp.]